MSLTPASEETDPESHNGWVGEGPATLRSLAAWVGPLKASPRARHSVSGRTRGSLRSPKPGPGVGVLGGATLTSRCPTLNHPQHLAAHAEPGPAPGTKRVGREQTPGGRQGAYL